MVNHGIATGLLFLVIGMLTVRGGSKLVGDYGGVWKVAPILGGFFFIAALATIAMPGTNSFISEFLVLIGTFSRHPAWAVLATIGIVLAAVYMLWIFQRTMTGPVRGAAVVGGRGPEDIQEFLPPDPGDLPRDPAAGRSRRSNPCRSAWPRRAVSREWRSGRSSGAGRARHTRQGQGAVRRPERARDHRPHPAGAC